VVDTRFEELNFDEDELVIEPFELFEEGVDERERVVIRGFLNVEADETSLKGLTKECAARCSSPVYA